MIEATVGAPDDPPVVLLRTATQDWVETAAALAEAGRRAIVVAAPGGADAAGGVRALLAQLAQRPVVVAAGDACVVARTAADGDIALASGLVLVDPVGSDHPAPDTALPVLVVAPARSGAVAPGCEWQTIDAASAADRIEQFNALLLEFLERRAPRTAPEYRSGSDARTLRDALGCFATGVTVVTCFDPAGLPVGLTANSFTSVSLDPPLLLVCIANRAASLAAIEAGERFAVNVLHIGQQPTSNRFASRVEDRFADTPWEHGEFGAPVLPGSLASFECRRETLQRAGDHAIVIGEVLKARFEPRRDPLLYFRGKYRRLHFS